MIIAKTTNMCACAMPGWVKVDYACQASGRLCGREVGLPAVTLTGEQVAADRDREPVSGQPDLGMYPVVEGRDRGDRKQDDRVVTRITGQRAAHTAGGKAVAGLVVGPAVVVDGFVGAELPVGCELEVDRVPR